MISWPPRLRRFDPFKSQFREIEQIDECFNHSNRIVLLDPVVQAFRKQCRLSAIRVRRDKAFATTFVCPPTSAGIH